MKETALVIMAAGIGSRFGGGIKQLAPVGPSGEIIMDYSIHDALEAGFNKIIFIIRKDLEKDFKEIIGNRIEKVAPVEYAFQEMDDLPEGFTVPEGRKKPWGTGQAVLAARNVIHEPFLVINADDYYGKEGFKKIHDYMVNEMDEDGDCYDMCMAGFILLGVVAYVALIMSGYTGKWESELKNPYIFLIPDSPLKKMWYATLMEHVKAFADGCIICIPIGIFWHVPVIEIIYCILIYTVLQADRLYTMVIVQSLLGEVFGKTGQSLLRMFIQMALLGVGAGVGVLAAVLISQTLIFPIVLIYGLMITVAMGAIALLRFDTMEQFV